MASDGDTVITPAQLKAGHERSRQQQKHVDAASRDRDFIVSTAWEPRTCGVCSTPIQTRAEAVYPRIDGQLEPRHRACHYGAEQPARLSGGAT